MTKKVPLIPSAPVSEFGDLLDSADFKNPQGMDRDVSYVPGFSDMRREHALAHAKFQRKEIKRDEVPVLPVNLRWARNQRRDGKPDNVKVIGHGQGGYRLVTQKDVGQPWLTELPASAEINADGTIRNGDTVLMVATRERAARNELQKRLRTEERVAGCEYSFTAAIAEEIKKNPGLITRGLSPSVTIETAPPPDDAKPVAVKAQE